MKRNRMIKDSEKVPICTHIFYFWGGRFRGDQKVKQVKKVSTSGVQGTSGGENEVDHLTELNVQEP